VMEILLFGFIVTGWVLAFYWHRKCRRLQSDIDSIAKDRNRYVIMRGSR